jgi:hypothetical protein
MVINMVTIREQLLSELPNMPTDKRERTRWKDKITKRFKCDRSYIDKIIRDVERENDPTI